MRLFAGFALAFAAASINAAAQPLTPVSQRTNRQDVALPDWAVTPRPAPRRAFVAGVSDYDAVSDLTAPPHDAELMSSVLEAGGFDVERVASNRPTYNELAAALEAFSQTIQEGDIVIVYFSGHGMMREGENFLIPSDAQPPEPGNVYSGNYISLDWVMGRLRQNKPVSLFVILDACRYDPFSDAPAGTNATTLYERVWPNDTDAVRGGLDETSGQGAHALGLSAGKNQIAYSYQNGDAPGAGSIYTRTLVEHLRNDVTLNDALNAASNFVGTLTSERVRPIVLGAGAPNFAVLRSEHNDANQLREWQIVHQRIASGGSELQLLSGYLSIRAADDYAALARERVRALSTKQMRTVQAAPPAESAAEIAAEPADRSRAALAGALRFSAVGSEFSPDFAVTSRQVALVDQREVGFLPRLIGDRIAPDRVIAMLPAGQELEIIHLDTVRNWAHVALPDGRVGTVRDVRLVTPTPRQSIELAFADGASETPTDEAPLATLTQLVGRDVRIVVGRGSGTVSPAHGNEIAYLRGQLLALSLEDMGADAPRVRVEISSDASLSDKALVEVISR